MNSMEHTAIVNVRVWMVGGVLRKWLRRIEFMIRDIPQIYRFARDGYKVGFTRDGWHVELNKVRK